MDRPEIQLISNIVVHDDQGKVLFVKYDLKSDCWWLPGDDLTPYQHPDERARQILDAIAGLEWKDLSMVFVESFRGRRGWHVMFNYRASGRGEPTGAIPGSWYPVDELPKTMHGKWERSVVQRVLEAIET
jgi:ADP-ribose pyrophosphatase YjhB (NUDIX family)